jgi:transcriptional regulator with XRE-family HTH domain
MRLGQKLRARRIEIGLSQERLADLLGVTFQQVQKYEKGVNRIAASRLFHISAALDVPVGYFFEGLSLTHPDGVAEDAHEGLVMDALAMPESLRLLTLFASIKSVRLRRRVLDLLRALVDESNQEEAAAAPADVAAPPSHGRLHT